MTGQQFVIVTPAKKIGASLDMIIMKKKIKTPADKNNVSQQD